MGTRNEGAPPTQPVEDNEAPEANNEEQEIKWDPDRVAAGIAAASRTEVARLHAEGWSAFTVNRATGEVIGVPPPKKE